MSRDDTHSLQHAPSRAPGGRQGELALFAPPAAEDEILVPARMVNEWIYCPRLAVLEWGRGEWAGNADTAAGRRAHRATETGAAPALPAPEDLPDDRELKTRRLLLSSERLGLTAALDVIEAEDGVVTPVDIKAGKRPHVAEGVWLPERVQVCVQALLLREAGYRCEEGAIWFAGSRERVRVELSEELIATTLRAASELRLAVAAGRLPPPLDHSPKCIRCSLLPVCLPDEVNWFRKGAIARTPPPPATPALPLYVQTPGARVTKKDFTLAVQVEGDEDRVVPFDEVSELVLAGPVSLTTPAVHELLRRDVPVAWMSSGFWYLGSTGAQGPRSATVRTAQYAFAADEARRLAFARELVAAKIRNSRTMLRRNWRGEDAERGPVLARLALLAERTERAGGASALLGLEGEAGALYFRALPRLFTQAVASLPAFAFERRNRRPPADPVNACLSLAYALLTRTFASAISITGLDPWKGVYHVERPGRPALALDLIEPFRPLLADSAVLMALNNGELGPGDFVFAAGGCNLKTRARRSLIAAYERRLDQETTHPVFGYQLSMRRLIQVQARLFARFVGGEIPRYPLSTIDFIVFFTDRRILPTHYPTPRRAHEAEIACRRRRVRPVSPPARGTASWLRSDSNRRPIRAYHGGSVQDPSPGGAPCVPAAESPGSRYRTSRPGRPHHLFARKTADTPIRGHRAGPLGPSPYDPEVRHEAADGRRRALAP